MAASPQLASDAGETPVGALLAHLDELPTLPPVAIRLISLAADDGADARDLGRTITADPALAARVLRFANAAALGGRAPVDSLDQAVVRLGFAWVRNAALAVKVFECFPPDAAEPDRAIARVELWKHALAVAAVARRLAVQQAELGVRPERAYVAGLLHDIGKIALDAVFPKAYARAVRQAEREQADLADSERAVLGVDHTVAGRRLAQRWELPEFLQQTIWLHHLAIEALPEGVVDAGVVALVQLADTLAREQRVGQSGNPVLYRSAEALGQQLGIAPQRLKACAAALAGDVAEQCALLGMEGQDSESLYLQSLQRANAELGRLNAAMVASGRRLEAAGRCYRALSALDAGLRPDTDLGSLAAAIAEAAGTALEADALGAFVLHAKGDALELAWIDADARQRTGGCAVRLSAGGRAWLRRIERAAGSEPARLPDAVRDEFGAALRRLAWAEPLVLPISCRGTVVGGLLVDGDGPVVRGLAEAGEEIRPLLASFGSAIERGRAHAAAQRLSEDLAESHRRLQQAQAELLRTRTLSMIAEMAMGAAHELNSPLAVISGRAQMLAGRITDEELRRALNTIATKAHECSQVVSELMDFARPRSPQFAAVSLGEVLAAAWDAWLKSGASPASLLRIAGLGAPQRDALPVLRADREQIVSVLSELVRNSVQALAGGGGSISIDWSSDQTARHRPRMLPAETAAGWVEIVVQDTGCGMAPAVAQRAFDPFFSHRAAGRGRGLGLARACRIVEAHGGRMWLESRPGAGTRVGVVLPRTA